MKPNFALDIREASLALLHRTPRGWRELGEIEVEAPDLPETLEALRQAALDMEPRGVITTKLLIPASQILYTTVELTEDQAETEGQERRAVIAAALDGRTPYEVADLVFDWAGDGAEVRVAAIARETLQEAESFAMQFRLNPVSFAAIPPEGAFPGEPWFGTSGLASSYLSEGERVERDRIPVTITARGLPEPEPEAPEPAVVEVEAALEAATPDAEALDEALAPEAQDQPEETPDTVPPPAPEIPRELPVELPGPGPNPDQPTEAPDLPQELPEDPPADLPPLPEVEPLHDPEPDQPGPEELPPVYDAADEDALTPPERALPLDIAPPTPFFGQASAADEDHLASDEGADDHGQGYGAQGFGGQDYRGPDLDSFGRPLPQDAAPAASDAPFVPAGGFPQPTPLPPLSASDASARPWLREEPRDAEALPEDLRADTAASEAPAGDEAPMAVDVPQDDDAFAALFDDLPPRPSKAAQAAFAARRPTPAAPVVVPPAPVGTTIPPRSVKLAAPPRPAAISRQPVISRPRLPELPPLKKAKPEAVIADPRKTAIKRDNVAVTASVIPGGKKGRKGTPAVSATANPAVPPAAARSASGAAAAQTFRPRGPLQTGKPRYLGLILTAVLLLILALGAAWSSFYLVQDDSGSDSTAVGANGTAPGSATLADAASGEEPSSEDEMLADQQDPADFEDAGDATVVGSTMDAPAAATGTAAAALAAPAGNSAASSGTEAAPRGTLGASNLAATSRTPADGPQDEIFLASADAPPSPQEPHLLSAPAGSHDALPETVAGPPPFGTTYQFDAEGRIQPTAEGIITPDGVTLTAGRPAIVPPLRPETVASAAAALAATAALPAGSAATDAATTEAPVDPALAAARPRARPEGIAPATAEDDGAALDAAAGQSDLASLRPRSRSETALAAGEAARLATASASLAAENPAAGALLISQRPSPRPRDLSRAVEAAVAAAVNAPPPVATRPEPEAVVVAAAQPAARSAPSQNSEAEADDEPEVASAAPKIPVKASVAKQATVKDAISLSKTNLIGVYGTPSNRYALIRQSNGRYTKVRIGDTLDGGRVTGISATEVMYKKGSRSLSLAMPKS